MRPLMSQEACVAPPRAPPRGVRRHDNRRRGRECNTRTPVRHRAPGKACKMIFVGSQDEQNIAGDIQGQPRQRVRTL